MKKIWMRTAAAIPARRILCSLDVRNEMIEYMKSPDALIMYPGFSYARKLLTVSSVSVGNKVCLWHTLRLKTTP